jgi:succinate dehydrogenase / fumarate reductase flavoprotein subunit
MGGLWVDYNLMSTIKGIFVVGEANFSDHGANRLGASALMQGLADGYFVLPYTIGNYLRRVKAGFSKTEDACFAKTEEEVTRKITRLLAVKGDKPADHFHRKLGEIIWDYCGMSRSKEGLKTALEEIPELRKAFWEEVSVPGSADSFNPSLEYAGRVADFLEFGEIMVRDALEREESCGAHFRQEYSTEDSEAKRNDEDYSHVTVWEYAGDDRAPRCHLEHLEFSYILPSQRSYK